MAIALTGALAIGAAACGGDTSDGDASGTATSPPSSVETATTTETSSTTSETADSIADAADDQVHDETVVALDESAALNLISLGIIPDMTLTTLSSELFVPIAESMGLATSDFSIVQPSFEYLVSLKPDRIVALENPFVTNRLDSYTSIAPVVLIPVEASWQAQVAELGSAFDRDDAALEVIARVETKIDEIRDHLNTSGQSDLTVSVMTARGEMAIAATADGPAGAVLEALEIGRPAAQMVQSSELPFVNVPLETMGDHDADIIILGTGADDLFNSEWIRSAAVFPSLSAVAEGAVYDVAAEPWIVGGSAFGAWWIASDIDAIVTDTTTPAPPAKALDRWNAFMER